MAPSLFVKPCVVVLAIAVALTSRLMSTNGVPVRLRQQQSEFQQQQQQQRHHSTGLEDGVSDSDPELDIDRIYALMNDNHAAAAAMDRTQQQQRPHQQLLLRPRPPPAAAAASAPAAAAAAAAVAAEPSISQAPAASATVDSQQQQHPVNQSTAAHAAEPRYHFEVHSVQHLGQPFQTARQKLRTVIRQAVAVEYHLKDAGDGRQTLIDDNELHRKRMASEAKVDHSGHGSATKQQDGGSALAAAAAAAAEVRYRIEQEQLKQLQEQEQRYYDEGELDDEEMREPYEPEPEPEIAALQHQLVSKSDDADEIEKRLKQKQPSESFVVAVAPAADGGDRRLPPAQQGQPEVHSAPSDDVDDESQPLALPVQADSSDQSESSSAESASSIADIYFLAVVVGCAVAGIAGFMFAGLCWYRLHRKMKEAGDVDYPAYGVTGPVPHTKESSGGVVTMPGGTAGSPGDRKLAQSAQMYHYQHQKQQMIASERLSSDVNHHVAGGNGSDVESEEENEDGDYTVFECPGLATNGEMEVRNPMFNDPTPVGTPADIAGVYGQSKK